MIQGKATPEATELYSKRFSEFRYSNLGKTGLKVSEVGFGGYRIDVHVDDHRIALYNALKSGVNLVDTSSNYTDGGSEILIGSVLSELIDAGEVVRESVVIVSKGGYIQGENYKISQDKKKANRPFPDLIEYDIGLEHCIHPEFIEDQITKSLHRLHLETIDSYLLHNPEYFFLWAKKQGWDSSVARTEFYRRIEKTFRHLEAEVNRGRIGCFGVSSNTFPIMAADFSFVCLEKIFEIAKSISPFHRFFIVQFPLNLFEPGGMVNKNQSTGEPVLKFAKANSLGVLINRPLNALLNRHLFRLASYWGGEVKETEIVELIALISQQESQFTDHVLTNLPLKGKETEFIRHHFLLTKSLGNHWKEFDGFEHWRETLEHFLIPRVEYGVQLLTPLTDAREDLKEWIETYLNLTNQLLYAITQFYQKQASKFSEEFSDNLVKLRAGLESAHSLSQKAIRILRATPGVNCVLVGMRKQEYVDDVLSEIKQPISVVSDQNFWESLDVLRKTIVPHT